MRALVIGRDRRGRRMEAPPASDETAWIDIRRDTPACGETLGRLLSIRLHDRHLADLRNTSHPPFFDGTDEYDLLILRGPDARTVPEDPRTRAVAFVVTATTVVTIHDADDDTFDAVYERLLGTSRRVPGDTAALLHLLLNEVVDSLLRIGDPVSQRLATLQDRLLDIHDPFDDWRPLMNMRTRLRWLSGRMTMQRAALDEWREQTLLTIDQGTAIRFNDLAEHISRVEHQADILQEDINGLLSVYFAAASQRTNKVVQFLAVISAVFLPLNLIAGVFGMNFEGLPLLHLPWAGHATLGAMLALGLLLWWWFKRNRWL